jgi:catechol 2,3-dioxygenase-like lactoylglutathione lyase family enzyme
MLQVRDVPASSHWYQQVVGLSSGHGGDEFEMLFAGEDFVLQLHRLDAHEHGALSVPAEGNAGAGVSLWFECDDKDAFDAQVALARLAGVTLAEEPQWNPLAHHYEAGLVDPDGYIVMLNSPFQPDA